jgi:hypothetical protein
MTGMQSMQDEKNIDRNVVIIVIIGDNSKKNYYSATHRSETVTQ